MPSPLFPRARRVVFGLTALTLPLAVASCDSGVVAKQKPAKEQCLSTEQFFTDDVWNSFMSTNCFACHNGQGVAAETEFVLQNPSQPGFLQANLEIVKHIAAFERDGVSILLLKPSAQIDHGGGRAIAKDSEQYNALEELVAQLERPIVCEDQEEDAFSGVVLLDGPRTFRKATLAIAGRLPTPDELAQLQGGDAADLDAAIDNLLLEEAFYTRLKGIYGDLFLTDKYFPNTRAIDLLDDEDYPNRTWYDNEFPPQEERTEEQNAALDQLRRKTNRGVARDTLELVAHIARNDLPWTEMVTADYMMVNPFSARVYGVEDLVTFVNPEDETEFVPVTVPSFPQAGVLTSPMWLNRFPTTDTNRNRHRARMVFKFFLATDVLKLADRPVNTEEVSAFNPTRDQASCNVCHRNIDPIAGTFQNFDGQGRYAPPEAWFAEMEAPGYADETLPFGDRLGATSWLGERLAADPLFALSTVHTVFKGLTGRDPAAAPTDVADPDFDAKSRAYLAQDKALQEIAQLFSESNFNIRVAVKGVLLSPYFRADSLESPAAAADEAFFASLGTARFLTPELLNTKITAVLGYPWTRDYDDNPYLLLTDNYLIYFGGMDFDGVTSRITEPNGLMAAVASRMSFEMSCRATGRDFTRPTEERLLFPFAEPGFEPEDENGFNIPGAEAAIKDNIVHLFDRVLAESRHPEDEEVVAAYQIWLETWREGKERVIADSESEYLPYRCRVYGDYYTNEELPVEERLERDDNYTIRAWQAVLAYLLSDAKFLHE